MTDELRRRPNDTIVWARGYLPKIEWFTDWVFRMIEWVIVIGFVDYLGQKHDSGTLRLLHAVLTALLINYAIVFGWSKAPLVPFGITAGKWRTRGIYAVSMVVSFGISGTLVYFASQIAHVAAQAGDAP